MNIDLNQTLFIISIFSFLGSAALFFHKTGAYKNTIDKDIVTLQVDVKENTQDIKKMQEEISEMKTNNALVISRLETLLIEVKTKLEMIMQGFFRNNEND